MSEEVRRKRYSTARQVCDRYGGRSEMWLWRILRNDPRFPRPMRPGSGKLRLFDEDELDVYDATCRSASEVRA